MKVAGDIYSAKCRFCSKNISIAGQGYLQLDSHMKGAKHLKNSPVDNGNSILLHVTPSQSSCSKESIDVEKQIVGKNVLFSSHEKELARNAEIMWAIDVVLSKYSYNSSKNKMDLFCKMFPDSNIAKNFSCGKTKCSYLISFGISPYFKELLDSTLGDVDYYVAFFD